MGVCESEGVIQNPTRPFGPGPKRILGLRKVEEVVEGGMEELETS